MNHEVPALHGTLVLVHGIFDTGRIFARMTRHFAARGLRVLAPDLKPSSGTGGLEPMAGQLKRLIDAEAPADAPLYLLGFSMGGLISRYYLQELGGLARVRRFVAVSVPQHGSRLAWLLPNRGCCQMRPGSAFLSSLNRGLDRLGQIPVLTLWTAHDLIIQPACSSLLPIGQSRRFRVFWHSLMIYDRRVLEAVDEFLAADAVDAGRPDWRIGIS
ncbi:esterase/lipase family protein [Desulfobulbus oralis]|uniref:AB hydrolase-1 domain-containing protein n=1 Tax=Desulfobulbus oralis TaxID=1986146 RepID=A0A2L1GMY5_9BACT|nr:alpha/beta fold hydrolase [Desulfobulbus oralis]AVD71051.1 hypothetical protein CAY53_05790 [Desulfobulbus oralis]